MLDFRCYKMIAVDTEPVLTVVVTGNLNWIYYPVNPGADDADVEFIEAKVNNSLFLC